MNQLIDERRITHCKKCNDTFTYRIQVTPEQLSERRLIVKMTCPFCKSKLVVDLNPWLRPTVTGYKGTGSDAAKADTGDVTLDLPDELPTDLDESE